jgi:uncharacterized protein YbaR (Trm112 family)
MTLLLCPHCCYDIEVPEEKLLYRARKKIFIKDIFYCPECKKLMDSKDGILTPDYPLSSYHWRPNDRADVWSPYTGEK